MKRTLPLFAVLHILAVAVIATPSKADEGEFRIFTDKKGQKIEAILLKVAPNWEKMKIRRKDGKEFETEIVNLSLDDQQFIKDWIKSNPVKTDYRLDVAIDRKLIKTNKQKFGSNGYSIETKVYQAEIKVTNLSREDLLAPVISYIMVSKEGVHVFPDSTGTLTFNAVNPSETNTPTTIRGEEVGQDIAYNRETGITTKPIKIDRVEYELSEDLYKDKFLGIIVQIKDQQGNLLKEAFSDGTSPELLDMSWEQVLKLPRANSENDEDLPARPEINGKMASGPSNHNLQKGDRVPGPVDVEKMPITIKARIGPASSSKDGAIVSIGNKNRGLTLFIEGDELIGLQSKGAESAQVMAQPPLGEFDVELQLSETSLKLFIAGKEVSTGTSLGLFKSSGGGGIEVGFDESPTVSGHKEPFAFSGKIQDVVINIGP